jgi:hypothetical protein
VVPDFLVAVVFAAWTMSGIFFVASFSEDNITSTEAGPVIARAFATLLGLSGLFVGMVALLLLRDERRMAEHYITPGIVGLLTGSLEGLVFLWPASGVLWAPFVLLIFALRPVRRVISGMLRPAIPRR